MQLNYVGGWLLFITYTCTKSAYLAAEARPFSIDFSDNNLGAAPKNTCGWGTGFYYTSCLPTYLARLWLSWFELLSEYGEVWLVYGQPQHDEMSVGPVEAVMGGGVVVRLTSLTTDVVHDLMLTLTGPGRCHQTESPGKSNTDELHVACM